MQSLAQFPQQFGQATAQALQTGLGAFGDAPTPLHPGGEFGDYLADDFDPFVDDADNRTGYPPGIDRFGAGSPEVPEGLYATAPMASWAACASRRDAGSASSSLLRSALPAPSAPWGGNGGHAVLPSRSESAASNEKEGQTDTKRISVPPVRNGAPVQGRITALPPQPGSMTTAHRRQRGGSSQLRRWAMSARWTRYALGAVKLLTQLAHQLQLRLQVVDAVPRRQESPRRASPLSSPAAPGTG